MRRMVGRTGSTCRAPQTRSLGSGTCSRWALLVVYAVVSAVAPTPTVHRLGIWKVGPQGRLTGRNWLRAGDHTPGCSSCPWPTPSAPTTVARGPGRFVGPAGRDLHPTAAAVQRWAGMGTTQDSEMPLLLPRAPALLLMLSGLHRRVLREGMTSTTHRVECIHPGTVKYERAGGHR